MNDRYLRLFGLNSDSTLDDVKKAYRKLAKQNHPDHYNDETDKKKQEIIMSGITEAYKNIISGFIASGKAVAGGTESAARPVSKENDYTLYKKGMEFYKIYSDSFFQIFHKREVASVPEKKDCLNKARSYFDRLILEYPASEWAFDSCEKLKKIKKAIENLE